MDFGYYGDSEEGEILMAKFRFQDLEIWSDSISLCDEFFDIADVLEDRKWFRFADQIRFAALSMPNNIAEGSGSDTGAEFSRFLGYSRRSAFENANMSYFLHRRGIIAIEKRDDLLAQCDSLSRRIAVFQKNLRS